MTKFQILSYPYRIMSKSPRTSPNYKATLNLLLTPIKNHNTKYQSNSLSILVIPWPTSGLKLKVFTRMPT